jgi:hypothetical protein
LEEPPPFIILPDPFTVEVPADDGEIDDTGGGVSDNIEYRPYVGIYEVVNVSAGPDPVTTTTEGVSDEHANSKYKRCIDDIVAKYKIDSKVAYNGAINKIGTLTFLAIVSFLAAAIAARTPLGQILALAAVTFAASAWSAFLDYLRLDAQLEDKLYIDFRKCNEDHPTAWQDGKWKRYGSGEIAKVTPRTTFVKVRDFILGRNQNIPGVPPPR